MVKQYTEKEYLEKIELESMCNNQIKVIDTYSNFLQFNKAQSAWLVKD